MPFAVGSRIGPYEILSTLGVGGMGEVYRATDTNLKRAVAIKVLPHDVADDIDRVARFQREAELLATLNHPNIAAIYGLERDSGMSALVMELVEGPTLADRIAEGAIPIDEALPVGRQIAEALEAAHEQGIIHRDLKPANIKLRPDGTVKVLDFGLAKALAPEAGHASAVNPAQSPTITSPSMMTRAGMILGTAAYMSPEQARGRPADKRSDVWAFGCVLYEMLTGKRAFAGDDVADTLAFVLTKEPEWSVLPPATPVAVRTLLRRCLNKDRKSRLDSAAAARLELDDAASSPVADARGHIGAPPLPVPLWRKLLPVAAVVIAAVATGAGVWLLKPAAPRTVTRFTIALAESDRFIGGGHWVAVSPDGRRVVYAVNDRLYLRAIDQLDATPIAGIEGSGVSGPRSPLFSPDSQWIAFSQDGQLKKVSVTGGAPVTICTLERPATLAGATWVADNTILFGRGPAGISRVSSNGGTPEQIINVDAGQWAHGPQLLPDGRSVLFTLRRGTGSWDAAQIVVQSLDTGARHTLITGGTDARYLSTGHLVYAHRDTVLAVPFDSSSLTVSGGPVTLLAGVRRTIAGSAWAQFAPSSEGTLAYIPSVTAARRTLVWVDRHGREEAIAAPPRSYIHPRLSPDGTRVAVDIVGDNRDIWIWDFRRGTMTRASSDPTADAQPLWTRDGQRLIFSSDRTGTNSLFWQPADGTGTAERLTEGNGRVAYTLSPNGRRLVLRAVDGTGGSDLAILDLGDGTRPPSPSLGEPLLQTSFQEYNAAISPDGRWLAYQSNSSGTVEVVVRPFPDVTRGQWPVSTAGGREPLWSGDSRELFYRTPTGAVMRVPVAEGSSWKAGTPTQLFEAAAYSFVRGIFDRTYDVSPDGKRFLMMKNADAADQDPIAERIIVVQNWHEELKRLVPTRK